MFFRFHIVCHVTVRGMFFYFHATLSAVQDGQYLYVNISQHKTDFTEKIKSSLL